IGISGSRFPSSSLFKLAWALLDRSLVLLRLGIGRMGAAQSVDIAGHFVNLVRLEHVLPGDHALLRHAVPNGLHVIGELVPVNPVIIGEVRPDQSAAVRAMAWSAQQHKGIL